MGKFSNTTPLPLTIIGGFKKPKLATIFWGGLKTESGNSETGNNIWRGSKN